jgi:hypothetical protein
MRLYRWFFLAAFLAGTGMRPAAGQQPAQYPSTNAPVTSLSPSLLAPQTTLHDPEPVIGSPLQPWGKGDPQSGLSYYSCGDWSLQIAPEGLLYASYLAGNKEPRLSSQWVHIRDYGWVWDPTVGARVGLLRYGPVDDPWPDGWQLDAEGAVFPRLDLGAQRELVAADFRAGGLLTNRHGPWESKFGYYHISAHLGDEYAMTHSIDPLSPNYVPRIGYIRDCLIYGIALRPIRDMRFYFEVGYGFYAVGGAKPWEFQFGAEYSSVEPSKWRGTPFLAVNTHLRQDNDFSGNVTLETGWQWRGQTGHLLRVGFHYFNGMSEYLQFFALPEDQVGIGLWYDF